MLLLVQNAPSPYVFFMSSFEITHNNYPTSYFFFRWQIDCDHFEKTSIEGDIMPQNIMNNYFSIGVVSDILHRHHNVLYITQFSNHFFLHVFQSDVSLSRESFENKKGEGDGIFCTPIEVPY